MNLPLALVTVTESAVILSIVESPTAAPSKMRCPFFSTRHGYGVVRIPQTGKRGKPIKPKRVCVQRELSYIADFTYTVSATGEFVVEDAKGYKGGATYRIFVNKKKLMREKYGIEVREV